jgi:glycosyltransferase involved in cell wall biosynthesis
MTTQISVVVATRNRAGYLRKAIESLVHQSLDPKAYEIIVVDNGSQDETKLVVEEFGSFTNLHYVFEPKVGLSRARNTGWKNAQGEYIALLDDDAIADFGWLEKYLQAFDKFGQNAGLIGGRVELIWEAPKPDWMPSELLGFLSFYHYADIPVVLDKKQWLSACSLAFPRRVIQDVGGFREDLGREGNSLRAGGEEYLRRQIEESHLQSIYYPDAVVHHHVASYRLSKKWFMNAAYWQGRSYATILNPPEKPLQFGEKIKLGFAKILWISPRIIVMIFAANPAGRFRRWFQVIESTGFISGLFFKEK